MKLCEGNEYRSHEDYIQCLAIMINFILTMLQILYVEVYSFYNYTLGIHLSILQKSKCVCIIITIFNDSFVVLFPHTHDYLLAYKISLLTLRNSSPNKIIS